MASRSGLALSDDGKWLAYFRARLDDASPFGLSTKVVEIIEAETGKVVGGWKVGPALQRMNAVAFDGPDQDVLLARVERDPLMPAPAYIIQRWSRTTGKVTKTVTFPVADSGSPSFFPRHAGRLVFSADRKRLLSIPAEAGKRATVLDLDSAKPLRDWESDFTPEAFFPDGRRIIGMSGSDIVVRDVATGVVIKRWPMPDGLVSIMGNLRDNPGTGPFVSDLQPDAQSLWVSPDGRFVAAYGQRAKANYTEMPTTIFLLDAGSGQLRARVPIPDLPTGFSSGGPAPSLAFDAESHMLAVATTKSLSLFSVPQGTPLISAPVPELDTTPAGLRPGMRNGPLFTMPTACSSPAGQTGCSRPSIRRT